MRLTQKKERKAMLRAAVLSLLVCASVLATGCNTIAGAGKDIKAGGSAIENAAERAR